MFLIFLCHEKIKTCKKLGICRPNQTFTGLELFAPFHILHQKKKKEEEKHYVHISFYSEVKLENIR